MKGKKTGMFPKLISILLTFVQVVIALYILLQFFGANATPFVNLLNSLSEPILKPFQGIFHPIIFNEHSLNLSAVFALIVYSIIGFGIQKVLAILKVK
ncbi:YggT family protein [Sporolactobacillus kofuensis]|uniref:YggT family protein n=1 Tax=Sporolactobacillus kofuensis TaxID=269672 RepID=A0ABW1WHP7_9BACL|nr:YggT family protein [Sporolactobacillus kofuensis]MCO7176028.1 YggT family protein [Sporolactobacillus kofuensis]